MNSQTRSKEFFSESGSEDGLNIDFKRILFRALRYWYVIVLSLMLALAVAFLINRYSKRIYPVTASVIVKEAGDMSGAELLYNNALVKFRRNYLNEPYIIKSYPLVQRVIEDLNFNVAFYREGNILTTESYQDLPIEAFAFETQSNGIVRFIIKVLNAREFEVSVDDEKADAGVKKFGFGDTLSYQNFKGVIKVNDIRKISGIVDEPIIFTYIPSSIVTERYVRNLKVEWAEEGAGVINLSISGASAQKATDFLKGLIQHYQNNDLENKNQTASRTVDFISEQLEGISDSLRLVEQQLEQFKNKNVVTDLSGEALRLYEKIEGLEVQKMQLVISKNYYKYLVDYISGDKNLDQIILPSSVGITDEILTGLVSTMTQIQLEIKGSQKTENNPLISGDLRRIQEIKKDIIESVRNQESTDNIKLDFLDKQIRQAEKQLGYLPVAQRTLISIQRNYTLLENLYIFLLQKRSEAAISQASNVSDIILVNSPQVGQAISPKPARNYLLAGVLGVFLPMIFFGLVEVMDNRVQSKEDIEKVTTIPFIGGVGHKKGENNLAVFNQPKSALAESFRALRSNLNYFIGHKEKAVFLITSSISGEGKSFTSINLASVLSMSGKRTLIVGADMRKPKIFDDFSLSNDIGLSSYLAGIAGFKEIIKHTSFSNLDFVSGGPVPPNPGELLLTARMKSFIDEAKASYDFVVIDTPPLAVVTDAFAITQYADHVLFLVRQNYTPKQLLKTIQDHVSMGKLKDISIVLNDIYKSGPGYGYGYGYNYGYGYGYGYREKDGHGYYQ